MWWIWIGIPFTVFFILILYDILSDVFKYGSDISKIAFTVLKKRGIVDAVICEHVLRVCLYEIILAGNPKVRDMAIDEMKEKKAYIIEHARYQNSEF